MRCGGKKSMCVAAKGWLQRRAATLLLLWVGFFLFLLCLYVANYSLSLFFLDTVPKSVSEKVKKEHSLKTLLVL